MESFSVNYKRNTKFEIPLNIKNLIIFSTEEIPNLSWIREGIEKITCISNNLRSFTGCPSSVKTLDISKSKIDSLEGCPRKMEILNCSGNNLTSLKYCPLEISLFDFSSNKVESLEELEETIIESLYCEGNPIYSLKGCPKMVKNLNISETYISDMRYSPNNLKLLITNDLLGYYYLPSSVEYLSLVKNKMSLDGSPFNDRKDDKQILKEIHETNLELFTRRERNFYQHRLKRIFLKFWYIPNDQGISNYSRFFSSRDNLVQE